MDITMEDKLFVKDYFIEDKIIYVRNQKVILDFHLAELYGVETRVLKQQVKRNISRFPDDFMLELTDNEIDILVSQFVIPHKKVLGGAKPFAFTEQGVAMLSSVLRSPKAIEVNIAIMRTFVKLRQMMESNSKLKRKIEDLEEKYDEQFQIVFKVIKSLISEKSKLRNPIGFT
jgi:hypothetical protein